MGKPVAIRQINPDGTCLLADGRQMQLVMSFTGSIGARPLETRDHLDGLDQTPVALHPSAEFDLSGLDQIPSH